MWVRPSAERSAYLLHLQSGLAEVGSEPAAPRLLLEEAFLGEPPAHLSLYGCVLVHQDVIDPTRTVPEEAAVDLSRKLRVLPSLNVVLIVLIL